MPHIMVQEDVEYIREVSDKALDLMSEYNVVPTPSNYQVWYSYASEADTTLNRVINDMIKKGKSFTSDISRNIYEKFFSSELIQNSISTAGQGLQSELSKIAKTFCDMNKGTVKYGAAISESMTGIEKIPGGIELQTILSGLLTETTEMNQKNSAARSQLKESAQTVQKLQTTLEAVRKESLTDSLTGIGNRKSFEEDLSREMIKANSDNGDLCLVIGDIDHFKNFNDTWGHHVGDQVLKAVAHTMKTRFGGKGQTARYGGEEFVILLPGMTLEKTQQLTDSIRQAIAQRRMKRKSTGETIGKVTCSFGIAKYRPNEHRNEFIERADAALYTSKNHGRNSVTAENEIRVTQQKIA